jgi:hypothetical protein
LKKASRAQIASKKRIRVLQCNKMMKRKEIAHQVLKETILPQEHLCQAGL